jgi:hypothetical protein
MRWLALAACSDKLPEAPDAASFKKMTAEERCEATAPRATRCVDALMIAQLESLGSGLDDLGKKLRDEPRATDDEAREMHRTYCAEGPSYADTVFACWDIKGCRAFAACVMKLERRGVTQR